MAGDVGAGRARRAADHRGRRLVDRQAARDVGREAHPQQPVLADGAVHVGAELDPVGAVPQHGLLGDPQVTQAELGDQAAAGRAALGPHPGRDG